MKHTTSKYGLGAAAAALWLVLGVPVQAADDVVYGRELMTEQEMTEHRARMRSFQTEQEREAYRLEHHKLMQERARERGVTLPDEPLPRGRGMGVGPRDGSGRGLGQGGQGGAGPR